MACTTGCPTQDHPSYGDCLRSKRAKVAYCNSANGWDLSKQKRWDNELADYRSARKQGIEPEGTDRASIDKAVKLSDMAGKAYDANTRGFKE